MDKVTDWHLPKSTTGPTLELYGWQDALTSWPPHAVEASEKIMLQEIW